MRLTVAAIILSAAPAAAELRVAFIEGAPKDRFAITNIADCALGPLTVEIQLAGSAGGLIFDTTGAGAGVEVFQPFEVVAGADILPVQPLVVDGDQMVALDLLGMAPAAQVAFTIDVDDTRSDRQITVAGSEIVGASVRVNGATGMFDETSVAVVPVPQCRS